MKWLTILVVFCSLQVKAEDMVWVSLEKSSADGLTKYGFNLGERHPINRTLTSFKMAEAFLPTLSSYMHLMRKRCAGFRIFNSLEEVIAANKEQDYYNLYDSVNSFDYAISNQELILDFIDQIEEENIADIIRKLASYHTRYYDSKTGVKSTQWIKQKWQKLIENRTDVSLKEYKHKWLQPSLILTIQGSVNPEEIVIVGGHADSIASSLFGNSKKMRSPGADDNASGIGTITETLRILMENNYKPEKTLQFIAYSAEEVGLLGSAQIAKEYRKEDKNVVGVIQFDMTNFKGTDDSIYLISDHTSKEQNKFLAELIDEYVKVGWGYTKCGYSCSDHASWDAKGYTASFPFESKFKDYNPQIHTKNDVFSVSNNNVSHAATFSKLAIAYAVEMTSN